MIRLKNQEESQIKSKALITHSSSLMWEVSLTLLSLTNDSRDSKPSIELELLPFDFNQDRAG
jgi:hypothetical protein